jgi:hypothetical protein
MARSAAQHPSSGHIKGEIVRKPKLITLAATITIIAGLFLASAPAAFAAAPSSPSTALACLDNPTPITGVDDNWHWPPFSSTVTTAKCADINVRITRTVDVRTCFEPTSGAPFCNAWRTVFANTWGLAATDVRDGTRFYLLFSSGSITGHAAY